MSVWSTASWTSWTMYYSDLEGNWHRTLLKGLLHFWFLGWNGNVKFIIYDKFSLIFGHLKKWWVCFKLLPQIDKIRKEVEYCNRFPVLTIINHFQHLTYREGDLTQEIKEEKFKRPPRETPSFIILEMVQNHKTLGMAEQSSSAIRVREVRIRYEGVHQAGPQFQRCWCRAVKAILWVSWKLCRN